MIPESRLNEAFCLAVGARGIGPGEAVFDALTIQGHAEDGDYILILQLQETASIISPEAEYHGWHLSGDMGNHILTSGEST